MNGKKAAPFIEKNGQAEAGKRQMYPVLPLGKKKENGDGQADNG